MGQLCLFIYLYGDIMGYRGRKGEGGKHGLGGYNDQTVDGLPLLRGKDVKDSIGGDNDYTVLLLHQGQEGLHAQVVTTTRLAGISLKKGEVGMGSTAEVGTATATMRLIPMLGWDPS
jgi:hypothetical protein